LDFALMACSSIDLRANEARRQFSHCTLAPSW
jgi:hypothetical protein